MENTRAVVKNMGRNKQVRQHKEDEVSSKLKVWINRMMLFYLYALLKSALMLKM